MLFTCATAQNKPNIHSFTWYWYSLVKKYLYFSFSNCTRNAQCKHHSLSPGAVVMNTACHRAATALSGTTARSIPCPTHTSGVPAESQSTALARAAHRALTCTHHTPPAWAGTSRGAPPGCCVSRRRHASAGHGWTTWTADHCRDNQQGSSAHGSREDLVIVCLYRQRDTTHRGPAPHGFTYSLSPEQQFLPLSSTI